MKKLTLILSAVAGFAVASHAQTGTAVSGCPGAFGAAKLITGKSKTDTSSSFGASRTFVKDTIYVIKKLVRVANGSTLNVQAGTIIMGFPGPVDTSALVIQRGGVLNVQGNSSEPVVMTSCKIQGARNRGDWGGLVICGRGVNNLPGGVAQLEGNYGAFHGGSNNEDNSGSIEYLRVEFAGIAFAPNVELNGITLGSVGAGTKFSNIQVSHSGDDSFEWFGGAVNGKNLIAWKGIDDDFDTDNGYSGMNQYGIAYRDYAVADFSGSNGFESDNNNLATVLVGGNPDLTQGMGALPKTTAIFSNFTMFGPQTVAGTPYNKFFKTGALLRRNTEQDIYNSVFLGFPGDTLATGASSQGTQEVSGIYINNPSNAGFTTSTTDNAATGKIRLKKNVVQELVGALAYGTYGPAAYYDNSTTFDATKTYLKNAAFYNTTSPTAATGTIANYVGALKVVPAFRLKAANNSLNKLSSFKQTGVGTKNLTLDLPFNDGVNTFDLFDAVGPRGFDSTKYVGANGYSADASAEWAEPWAEYNPNLFKYTAGVTPTRKGVADNFLAGNPEANTNSIVCAPNPAITSTEISFIQEGDATDAALTVLDMAGNVVFAQTSNVLPGVNNVSLNTNSLQPGTYIVRVSANGTVAKTTKLSVVR